MTKRNRSPSPRTVYAMTDPATAAAGLFRVPEKTPGWENLNAVTQYQHGGVTVELASTWRLTDWDWRVFLALCGLAGLEGAEFGRESRRAPAPDLWDRFAVQGEASSRRAVLVRTSVYALLREIGAGDTGPYRRKIWESLRRLDAVTKSLRQGNKVISGGKLLSYALDQETGAVAVGLSPMIASALLGEQHVTVSLADLRRLKQPAAVILHGIFSARLRPGRREARYRIDSLSELAYGPTDDNTTARKRRQAIRAALAELDSLTTWRTVAAVERGNAIVSIWRSQDVPTGLRRLGLVQELGHADAPEAEQCGRYGGLVEHGPYRQIAHGMPSDRSQNTVRSLTQQKLIYRRK